MRLKGIEKNHPIHNIILVLRCMVVFAGTKRRNQRNALNLIASFYTLHLSIVTDTVACLRKWIERHQCVASPPASKWQPLTLSHTSVAAGHPDLAPWWHMNAVFHRFSVQKLIQVRQENWCLYCSVAGRGMFCYWARLGHSNKLPNCQTLKKYYSN